MAHQIRIARQPIVTRDQKTFGYELLFRDFDQLPSQSAEQFISDNQFATSRVTVNALNQFGIKNLVGDYMAFLNADEEFLLGDAILTVPANKFVIELLEHIKITPEIIERIKFLREKKYRFALDDVNLQKAYMDNFVDVFELVDIVKLDITLFSPRDLKKQLPLFRKHKFKLLAEKVETKSDFEIYKALGCVLFQGYFFARPEIKEQSALDPQAKAVLNLINLLDEEGDQDEIVDAFELAPQISLQLLRYLNSAEMHLNKAINSIKHAIALLGRPPLKSWLLLISFSEGDVDSGSTTPLFDLVRTRSIMMGKLVSLINDDKTFVSEASFVGLLSLVENVFNSPLEDILEELNLDPDTRLALIAHGGIYGKCLKLVESLEEMDVEECSALIRELTFTSEEVQEVLISTYAAISGDK